MCGIAGVFEYQRRNTVSGVLLREMTDVIEHRGPDDAGMYLSGPIGIGMRRLSIIDVAGGKQPISNESDSVVLVLNGEIYNYCSLRDQLETRGHKFQTECDTEVAVHLYEEHGDECVHWLRGMFGFALWDKERQRLLLARDRLGIKPLYFADINGVLIFGSEIKSILQHPAVVAELNYEALSNFLSLKYVPSPETMFRGIYAVPPGFLLTCSHEGVRLARYWDLDFTFTTSEGEDECAERLDDLLRESVKLHLQSDVPFGAFLSGGLDSSTIVALMAHYLNHPVKTFSIGFEGAGAEISEASYARLVAEHFGTQHHEVIIGASDFVGTLDRVMWHLDQPVADLACCANMLLAENASRHVKMVLTGEGGDELFAGYARYAGERFRVLTKLIPSQLGGAIVHASSYLPGLRRPKLALKALMDKEEASRLLHWFPLFGTDEKIQLLTCDAMQATTASHCAETVLESHLMNARARDQLSRMLYMDTKLWLPDDLLARGDKMSMAASIEARVPLLDHKLVEFAASLPSDFKLRKFTRKYLLRKVASKLLPEAILHRKKQGFPMPISAWFRGEAKEILHDLLSRDTVRRRGLFNPDYTDELLRQHQSGDADRGAQLWGLLLVELWMRQFLDVSPRRLAPIPSTVMAISPVK
jgi:asparagine synthase (glutamine-hydrolysing)